jgi:glycosyltransferase involved in cell wall biosynthesis
MTHVFFAAYILKKLYPDKVSIIGMVHHDMVGLYKRNKALEPYIDMFICVSSDTRKKMIEKYRIEKDKVLYKEVPIPIVEGYVKEYSKDGEPLQINFASRLVKSKKRADLIIPLIKKLEKYNINYNLNIAGGGDYYDKIKEYIKKNDLKNKVKLYGSIKYEEMAEFWKKGDIVLSISDSEGMGLSILEGMSFGLVPIVTDTSGIWDFITPKINGFICEINNIDMIVESIKELDNDRNTVKVFGEASKNIIKRKCSVSEYVKWVCSIQNNEKHND